MEPVAGSWPELDGFALWFVGYHVITDLDCFSYECRYVVLDEAYTIQTPGVG